MAINLISTSKWFLITLFFNHGMCANILISSLYGEGSHFMLGASVGEGLIDRGHNVTCLISRAFDDQADDPSYRRMHFEVFDHNRKSVQEIRDFFYHLNTIALRNTDDPFIDSILRFMATLAEDCEGVIIDTDLMKRLENIDAIIMDTTWSCGMLIRAMLVKNLNYTKNITLVSLTPVPPQPFVLYVLGSSCNPAYQPESMSGLSNRMTFLQRTANLLQSLMFVVMGYFVTMPYYAEIAMNVGLDPKVANIWKWQEMFDLHLLSMDFSSEFPFPLAPNFIPVGGLTARPAKQLPEDLEAFMQSSGDDGAIVFTMGTYFASVTKFQPGFVEKFAEAFGRLPQKVIWQLVDVPDWELPPNIRTMKWVPQNDLLGHPKTRVFLYQGGNNGFQEACYHGIPIVVLPLYGDQYDVSARILGRGMGRKLDKNHLSADDIYETLSDVINDPKYMKVAKHVSAVNKNNPMTARERAAFWVEHVIRFGGDYLKSPTAELSFIQYHMIDVLSFLIAIVCLVVLVVVFIIRFCLRHCWRIAFGSKLKRE